MRADRTVVILILVTGVAFASTAAVVYLVLANDVPRLPVVIDGDSELNVLHGVVRGNGTAADPYVIEGGAFDSSTTSGITIRNTQASIVIRDVTVRATRREYPYDPVDGISIFQAANVRIENVTSSQNFVGISVTASRNVTVTGSHLSNDTFGVAFANCRDSVASGNTLVGDDWGVWSDGSERITMANNTGAAATLSELSATSSSNVTVVGNAFSFETTRVVVVESSADVLVAGNVFLHSYAGVHVEDSSRFNISRNRIESGGLGIDIWSSANFTIGQNLLRANAEGLHVQDVSDGLVVGNLFEGNDYAGMRASNATGLRTYHNSFMWNNLGALVERSGSNAWDGGYPTGGNFWSNYTGVDQCSGPLQDVCTSSDGIGDTPVLLAAANVDRYPLMRPPDLVVGP